MKDVIKLEKQRIYRNLCSKKWRDANREKFNLICKNYRDTHKKEVRERRINWVSKNKSRKLELNRKSHARIRATIKGRIDSRMSTSIRKSLRGNKSGRNWETLVGYSIKDLRLHIESQFEKGMSWENYGLEEWHIDHIIPLSRLYFDGVNDPTFKFAWSLKNLQPLWAKDNLHKYNRLVEQKKEI